LVDGPSMNPPIPWEQACALTQPYWEWEKGYSTSTNSWSNIFNTDVFSYYVENNDNKYYFGDSTPNPGNYYVDEGYFSYQTAWVTENGDPLRRSFTSNYLSVSLPTIKNYLIGYNNNYNTFAKFLPYIHGGLHGMIHTFVGYVMSSTGTAAGDPLFYMHHCNIDRLYHMWVDCMGFELVSSSALNNNCPQYLQVNPIGGNPTQTKKDQNGNVFDVGIDTKLNFYAASTTATFWPQSQWPTIRQMWTMGNSGSPGFCGLWYRYGPDDLASALTNLCPEKTWRWVNVNG